MSSSRPTIFRRINLFLLTFFGCSLFIYFLMNGGAYWRILRYDLFLSSPLASQDLKTGDLLAFASQATTGTSVVDGSYRLIIPKLQIEVPIAVPEDPSKKGVLASLEEGVGLYPGSVGPGEAGRIILLGHSSRASWYRGDWAYVFATLHELKEFDMVYIVGNGKKYSYQIFTAQTLSPQDTNALLDSPTTGSEVDLVTCYPVGSASQRTVIETKLISTQNI